MKVYEEIAQTWQARERCEARIEAGEDSQYWSNWIANHSDRIEKLCKEYLPSGSGFDNGTNLDFGATRPNRLVFNVAFHHMDGHGAYDGWTDHQVIVTPDLAMRFVIRITGRDRNQIKNYIAETFEYALNCEVPE